MAEGGAWRGRAPVTFSNHRGGAARSPARFAPSPSVSRRGIVTKQGGIGYSAKINPIWFFMPRYSSAADLTIFIFAPKGA